MGFGGMEDRMLRSLDSAFEDKPVIRAAHKRAEELFKHDSIRPATFADLYGDEVIKKDEATVARLKQKFDNNPKNKIPADILEGIIYEHTELSDWFGPHASTIKTSEFDDIVNGVDLAIEFDEPQRSASHLALGVDATFGTGTIGKKFDRIKAEIDRGQLATIKYFESTHGNFKGQLSQIPRVVIGTEKEAILRLAGMWTQGEKKELGAHPIQQLLLLQTYSQLTTFASYAKKIGRNELVRPYETAIAIMENIMKNKDRMDLDQVKKDKVHGEIISHLSMFK
jgi:hypothetical protein